MSDLFTLEPRASLLGRKAMLRDMVPATTKRLDVAQAAGFENGQRNGLLEAVRDLISNPTLLEMCEIAICSAPNAADAKAAVHKLLRVRGFDIRAKLHDVAVESDRLRREEYRLQRRQDMAEEIVAWLSKPFVLERVSDSVLHRALSHGADWSWSEKRAAPLKVESGAYEVFLIQHDWAGIMSNAQVDEGGVRLPFEHCCFETCLSGRRICALVDCEEGNPVSLTPLVFSKYGWFYAGVAEIKDGEMVPVEGHNLANALVSLIMRQVRAIAIALDTAVTETELIRAPQAQNLKRLKHHELPLFDYHIVSLANRCRADRLPASDLPYTKRRLHFRRGHWRHFLSHKTWIRWMLVGDASLGFVDKTYRL